MEMIFKFFKRLFCNHFGGEIVEIQPWIDYDSSRMVKVTRRCPKCRGLYATIQDRAADPQVRKAWINYLTCK